MKDVVFKIMIDKDQKQEMQPIIYKTNVCIKEKTNRNIILLFKALTIQTL